jgi:hypothetical protein
MFNKLYTLVHIGIDALNAYALEELSRIKKLPISYRNWEFL